MNAFLISLQVVIVAVALSAFAYLAITRGIAISVDLPAACVAFPKSDCPAAVTEGGR